MILLFSWVRRLGLLALAVAVLPPATGQPLSFAEAVRLAQARAGSALTAVSCPVMPVDAEALAARVAAANENAPLGEPPWSAGPAEGAARPLLLRTRADVLLCTALAFVQLEEIEARERLLGEQRKLAARLMEIEQRRVAADVDNAMQLTEAKALRARTRLEEAALAQAAGKARSDLAELTGQKDAEAAEGSMPPLPEENAAGSNEHGALMQLALGRDLVQLSAAAEYQARQRAVQDATLGKRSIGALAAARVNEQIGLAALVQASARLRAARLEALAAAGGLEAWADGNAAANSAEAAPEAKGGDAELVSLLLAPALEQLEEGRPQQFSAIATFAGGHARDVTAEARWSCTDQSRAALSTTGLLTGITTGRVTVSVTFGGQSRSRSLEIVPAPPEELLSPAHGDRKR